MECYSLQRQPNHSLSGKVEQSSLEERKLFNEPMTPQAWTTKWNSNGRARLMGVMDNLHPASARLHSLYEDSSACAMSKVSEP